MIDIDKIDALFNEDAKSADNAPTSSIQKHSRIVRRIKLLLPSIAAVLIGLLVIFPSIQKNNKEFFLDITRPKKGELEKLHIEKTVFNITDKDNKVHNFTADNIDETTPGSKVVKLTNPDGLMPLDEQSWANIKSPTGHYNQQTNVLELSDNVEMYYSDGMNGYVDDISFNFKTSMAESSKPVTATGFMGDINSEGIEINFKTGVVIFTGKTHIKLKEESLKETDL